MTRIDKKAIAAKKEAARANQYPRKGPTIAQAQKAKKIVDENLLSGDVAMKPKPAPKKKAAKKKVAKKKAAKKKAKK